MPAKTVAGRRVDVRPDRIDFRDFPYRPPLRNLARAWPDIGLMRDHIDQYKADRMVLNQHESSACTGFGLAAVINYLKWERNRQDWLDREDRKKGSGGRWKTPAMTSQSMLYLNARLYDEWDGEDYEGSSCRGAMKGWHKHGACTADAWPFIDDEGPGLPKDDLWRSEAAETVLGAYYRINAKSIVEMQAAIHEIHSIYVAADVHDGWSKLDGVKSFDKAVIPPPKPRDEKGGHAFALVGYTGEGFILQNSWGPGWGYNGFALLPYDQWIADGYDAWALALGAPIKDIKSPAGQSRLSLQEQARRKAGWSFFGGAKEKPELPKGMDQWDDDAVNHHVVISTIDGAPVRHLPDVKTAADCVQMVARRALGGAKPAQVAIYIHGGLNGKDDGLLRAGFMGPWFAANGIVPIFPIWQTDAGTSILHSLLETIGLDDLVRDIIAKGPSAKPDDRAIDRRVEDLARRSPGKAAWTEMKNKAKGLSRPGEGALSHLFAALKEQSPGSAVHLIGHSAGAIAACHALAEIKRLKLKLGTVSLYAPACTTLLANETLAQLPAGTVHIDHLSDRLEQKDACLKKLGVTVYSKSLLYLVSRALEDMHKTPILGLERTLAHSRREMEDDDAFHPGLIQSALDWQAAPAGKGKSPWNQDEVVTTRRKDTKSGKDVTLDNAHGAFDNNVDCVNATIRRITGALKVPVKDLDFSGG